MLAYEEELGNGVQVIRVGGVELLSLFSSSTLTPVRTFVRSSACTQQCGEVQENQGPRPHPASQASQGNNKDEEFWIKRREQKALAKSPVYAARGGGDHSMQSWRSPATSKLLKLLNPNFSYRCLPSGVAWMKACLFSAAACSIPQRRRRPPMPRRW